jgi:predicted nucleic acid-binding protein
MAALARLQREDPVCNEDLEQARQHLIQSWKTFTIVEVSQPLVETAGRFAEVFALRGYDSVQLAAAHELHVNSEQPVTFACYDRRLNQAAQLLQLEVLP